MPTQVHQRDLLTLLRYEADRRPIIADLCARAGYLTDLDIESADVPLPWYRKALFQLRDREVTARRMAQADATIDPFIVRGEVGDTVGIVAEYIGTGEFTEGDHGVQIQPGALLFFPDDVDDFWFDTVHVVRGARTLVYVSRPIARATRTEYGRMIRDRLNRSHANAPVIDLTGADGAREPSPPGALAGLGVRFQRL